MQRFRDYRVQCRALRRHLRKLLAVVQIEKDSLFRFCNFMMLQKQEKAFAPALCSSTGVHGAH